MKPLPRGHFKSAADSVNEIPGFDHLIEVVEEACAQIGVSVEKFFSAHQVLCENLIQSNRVYSNEDTDRHITQVIDPVGADRSQYFDSQGLLGRRASYRFALNGLFAQREDIGRTLCAHMGLGHTDFFDHDEWYEPFEILMQASTVALMNEAAEHDLPILLSWGGQSRLVDEALRRLQAEEYKHQVVFREPPVEISDVRANFLANSRYYEFKNRAHARANIEEQCEALSRFVPYHIRNADAVKIISYDERREDFTDVAVRNYSGVWSVYDDGLYTSFLHRYGLNEDTLSPDQAVDFPAVER